MKKTLLLIALLLSVSNAYCIPIYSNMQAEIFSITGNNSFGYNVGDEVNYYFVVDRNLPGTRTLLDGSVIEEEPIGPGYDSFFVDFLMGDMLPESDIEIGPLETIENNWGTANPSGALAYWFGSTQSLLRMGFLPSGGFDGGAYWIIEHSLALSSNENIVVSAYADADLVTVSDTPFPTKVPEPAAWLLLLLGIVMIGKLGKFSQ